jgi:hypothetical protein
MIESPTMICFPDTARSSHELAPAGSHLATLYGVVQFGTQLIEFNDETKSQRQIHLGFELVDERMADLRPFAISQTYNFSAHVNSTFREHLEGMLGHTLGEDEIGTLDLAAFFGSVAIVGVQHRTARSSGRVYAALMSLAPPPKRVARRQEPLNAPLVFSFAPFSRDVFGTLPAWMQAKISASLNTPRRYELEQSRLRAAPDSLISFHKKRRRSRRATPNSTTTSRSDAGRDGRCPRSSAQV